MRFVAMTQTDCGGKPTLWKTIAIDLGNIFKHSGITMFVYIRGEKLIILKGLESNALTDEHIAEFIEISA